MTGKTNSMRTPGTRSSLSQNGRGKAAAGLLSGRSAMFLECSDDLRRGLFDDFDPDKQEQVVRLIVHLDLVLLPGGKCGFEVVGIDDRQTDRVVEHQIESQSETVIRTSLSIGTPVYSKPPFGQIGL